MDPKKFKELEELAKRKEEKEIQQKKQIEDLFKKSNELEKTFKSKFSTLKTKVLKPFAIEAGKSGLNIDFLSNETSGNFDEQTRIFFTLMYNPNLNKSKTNNLYINFEGHPRKNIIQITRKVSLKSSEIEEFGEFQIDSLNADTLEELMMNFIREVTK